MKLEEYLRSKDDFYHFEITEYYYEILYDFFGISADSITMYISLQGNTEKSYCELLYYYTGFRDFEQLLDCEEFCDWLGIEKEKEGE